ncbi:FAD-dependent oxidoreductase [Clostridium sp.]|uniref:FAD-dependent oxidoreductase n=1 Tax=Clostridium sp. TaxID=1506 RepID=UPI001A5FD43B|nr:FAD-dependent oxidoreductase [Clostridium sp.]MBK5234966.1 FAD-dependent oxidoreductase [Clostridium sp.]
MSEKIPHINSEEFTKEVLESSKPVIIDFYSEDCAPCEVLAPIYEKMESKYGEHIKFVKMFRQANKDFAKSINVTSSPTVLFYKDGKEVGLRLNGFLNKPQVRIAIEEILGEVLPNEETKRVDCDVLILGAGAAGLSSAIYSSRAKMKTVIVDESVPGGQVAATYHIANYPGTPGVVKGKEIIKNMREQAISSGTIIDDLKEISEINLKGNIKYLRTEDTEYYAKAVIIASGAKPRSLPAENADEFKGKGIHYCATCDGSMYENRKIVVIGGGDSAVEEAVFLTRFASHITIISKYSFLKASKTAQEGALKNEKIDVIWDSEVLKVNGEGHALTSVVIENQNTKEVSEIPTEGAFVYIGTEPMSAMFKHQITVDKLGYIIASEDTKTNVEGVFVAGDIRTKLIRQVVTAASDGAVAGIMAERYIVSHNF